MIILVTIIYELHWQWSSIYLIILASFPLHWLVFSDLSFTLVVLHTRSDSSPSAKIRCPNSATTSVEISTFLFLRRLSITLRTSWRNPSYILGDWSFTADWKIGSSRPTSYYHIPSSIYRITMSAPSASAGSIMMNLIDMEEVCIGNHNIMLPVKFKGR